MRSDATYLRCAILASLFAAAMCAAAADTFDTPKRKAGLWEIKSASSAAQGHVSNIQHCIDEKTDNLLAQQGRDMTQQKCSKNSMRREGDRIVVESVCRFDKTTATTRAVFSGNFDSGYRGEMDTTYDPALMGMKQAKTTVEAKWLGPCKPGQKPGDMIMPGVGTFNANEMMKNMPNMQDMMKNMPRQK